MDSPRKIMLLNQQMEVENKITDHQKQIDDLQTQWAFLQEEIEHEPDWPNELHSLIGAARGMGLSAVPCTLGTIQLRDLIEAFNDHVEDHVIKSEEQEAADHLAAYVAATSNPDAVCWPTKAG